MEEKQIISSEELQSMLNDLQEPEKCDAFFTIYDVQALKANPNYPRLYTIHHFYGSIYVVFRNCIARTRILNLYFL